MQAQSAKSAYERFASWRGREHDAKYAPGVCDHPHLVSERNPRGTEYVQDLIERIDAGDPRLCADDSKQVPGPRRRRKAK